MTAAVAFSGGLCTMGLAYRKLLELLMAHNVDDEGRVRSNQVGL